MASNKINIILMEDGCVTDPRFRFPPLVINIFKSALIFGLNLFFILFIFDDDGSNFRVELIFFSDFIDVEERLILLRFIDEFFKLFLSYPFNFWFDVIYSQPVQFQLLLNWRIFFIIF